MYADVIFPLKIKPFTYKLPANFPTDIIGRIVRAPLSGRTSFGLVCEVRSSVKNLNESGIKEIISIHEHFGSQQTIGFLKWLSKYYVSPEGVALASCFFEESSKIVLKSPPANNIKKEHQEVKAEDTFDIFYPIINSITRGNYKSFFIHAPSRFHEHMFLKEFCKKASPLIEGAIFLVPEIDKVERIADILRKIFYERICIIHSKQRKKQRLENIEGIFSNQYNIIVGTRSAILIPLKKISFIAVLSEHSTSYKGEEGLRYNGRDVAIKRGFFEKIPVLLSSICPSVESIHNIRIGKYQQIRLPQKLDHSNPDLLNIFSEKKRPEIHIINRWNKFKPEFSLSIDILEAVRKHLLAKNKVILIVNKKGYSYIICKDCGNIVKCQLCQLPLVVYKNEKSLKCHRCYFKENIHDSCPVCNSHRLISFGLGIEKVKDDLAKFLKEESILFEEGFNLSSENEHATLIIGHSYQIKRIKDNNFKLAVFADVDVSLANSGFKSNEILFQEVIEIAQIVSPEGHIILQTKDVKNKILNFIKNYDFKGFYTNELSLRREGGFPPFMKLALLNIILKKKDGSLEENIKNSFMEKYDNEIIILGPLETRIHHKKGIKQLQFLLKSKNESKLNETVHLIEKKINRFKNVKLTIDIDPIKL